jgi:(p)ppGpp synthase/HD superfamily hydrolase
MTRYEGGEPMQLSDRFEDALVYATRLHAAQRRKGSDTPYIAHLLGVTALVLEAGGDEDMAIAALLHDAVEDQGGAATREAIRVRFGERVAAIVDGCTDTDLTPKPPWQARKEAYIAHVRHAPHAVRLVSLADKIHNMRSMLFDYRQIGEALWDRFQGGKAGSLWYYRALVDAYRAAESGPLVDELDRTLTDLERLAGVRE